MSKMRALGTALYCLPTYDDVGAITEVGALSSIGEISLDSDELDVTTLDSPGGYREFLQGFKDSGEVTLAGFHDSTEAGQGAMRTLYGSAATNYFWIMFPDRTVVAFTAYVKGYTAGAFEVDGAVGFGATLRVTGSVQVFAIKPAVAQSKTAGQTATMDSTTKVAVGTPVYQWYSNATNDYVTPDIIPGKTNATYTTGALAAGTYYYMCLVSSTNHRPTYSQIHVITVAP